MFVYGKSRTVFFLSDTFIYGISRDGSNFFNIRTCEHMILGQLSLGAHQTKNAPLARDVFFHGTTELQNVLIQRILCKAPLVECLVKRKNLPYFGSESISRNNEC